MMVGVGVKRERGESVACRSGPGSARATRAAQPLPPAALLPPLGDRHAASPPARAGPRRRRPVLRLAAAAPPPSFLHSSIPRFLSP